MLAGFFAHLLVEKRGPAGFIVDRCKRLGVPLLIMSPVIVALDWAERAFLQRHAALDPAYQPADTLLLRPLYLWFLEYLLIFSGFTWVLTRGRREPQGSTPRPLHVPEVLLIMALPTWIIRHWLGEPTPAFSFVPQAAALLHFGLFFTVGFILFASRPTETGAARARWLAIPGLLGLIWFFTQIDRWSESMLALQAGLTWLAVLGCFTWGVSQRTPGHQHWRTLVDSAYWVYLAHFPLVMGAHVLCRDLEMPAVLMFTVQTLLILIVTGLSFTSWVRTSPLAPWLGVKGRSS